MKCPITKQILLFLFSMVCASSFAQYLSIEDVTVEAGGTAYANVSLIGSDNVTSIQFYVSGEKIDGSSITIESITPIDDAYPTQQGYCAYKYNSSKSRYVVTAMDSEANPLNQGDFMTIGFHVSENLEVGSYLVSLSPILGFQGDNNDFYADDVLFYINVVEAAKPELKADDLVLSPGQEKETTLYLNSKIPSNIVGMQFYVYAPDGITIEGYEMIEDAYSGGYASIAMNYSDNKKRYIVSIVSLDFDDMLAPMCQGEGFIGFLKLKVKASEDIENDKDYTINLSTIQISHMAEEVLDPIFADDTSFTVSIPKKAEIAATDIVMFKGETGESIVSLQHGLPEGIFGVQFYVETPEGITLEDVTAVESGYEGEPSVVFRYNESKKRYIVITGTYDNSPMCRGGNFVEFLELKFKANEQAMSGDYNVRLYGFLLTYKKSPAEIDFDNLPYSLDDVNINVNVKDIHNMKATDVTLKPGQEGETTLSFNSNITSDVLSVIGMQFDVYVPDGITIEGFEPIEDAYSGGKHDIYMVYKDTYNRYVITIFSLDKDYEYAPAPMCQGEGFVDFLKLKVKASEGIESNKDYTVSLNNIEITYMGRTVLDPIPANDTSFMVTVDHDNPTDIKGIVSDVNTETTYSLSGIKTSNTLRKGIYIRNGKKVVVK